jgi:hypothetical protein
MTHAAERVDERLAQAGWDTPQRDQLMGFAERWAERTDAFSEAVRLQVLPTLVGTKYGDESNGNEVWAVYRSKRLITVMLRRDEQPDANLRVDKVTRLV